LVQAIVTLQEEIRNPKADCRTSRKKAQKAQKVNTWPDFLRLLRLFAAIQVLFIWLPKFD
jgi:hypothetical protein